MSDNEDPFPVLGDTEVLRIKHLPLAVIPKFVQRSEDNRERISVIVREESFDVLKEKVRGSVKPCNAADVKEECPSCLSEAFSLPSNAESLARKPCGDEVVPRYLVGSNSRDVSGVDFPEVSFVDFGGVFVPLVCPDALCFRVCFPDAKVESSYSCE